MFYKVCTVTLFIGIIIFNVSCSKNIGITEVDTQENMPISSSANPGKFSMSQESGIQSITVSKATRAIQYNLGNLDHSENIYFTLKNIGGESITSIDMSIDIDGINVIPIGISDLPTSNSFGHIIRVKIPHGRGLGEVNELLSESVTKIILGAKGYTMAEDPNSDGGDEDGKSNSRSVYSAKKKVKTLISTEVNIVFTPRYADIELMINDVTQNLTTNGVQLDTFKGALTKARMYTSGNYPVKIKNTGSVQLRIRTLKRRTVSDVVPTTFDIPVGHTVEITGLSKDYTPVFEIDSNSVTFDPERIQMGLNNKGYLLINPNQAPRK